MRGHTAKRILMKMQKEDIALGATGARSYERRWRAKKLSWNAIGKLWYLLYGAFEYMDEVTLCYPQEKFNKLRTALGFKQDSELVELVESADAFRIVRNKETGEMVAFMTPIVPDRFVAAANQEIVEPKTDSEVFYCKANALANGNDRDKIAENLHVHKNSINMKMLLAGNVPMFHTMPNEEAINRMKNGFNKMFGTPELRKIYFGEFLYHYQRKYHVGEIRSEEVLACYLVNHLTRHMACRVGIENWPGEAIAQWVKNYFGPRKLEFVITEAHDLFHKNLQKGR